MPQKFNIETADRDALVGRVTQLTSALVKQKETIGKLKSAEEICLAENEKLQRQIRLLSEEGEMGRQLRGDLQNEVARLQRSLDLLSAEMQMVRQENGGISKQSALPENGDRNLNPDDAMPNLTGLIQRSGSQQEVLEQSQSLQSRVGIPEVISLRSPMEAANAFLSKVSAQFKKETKDTDGTNSAADPTISPSEGGSAGKNSMSVLDVSSEMWKEDRTTLMAVTNGDGCTPESISNVQSEDTGPSNSSFNEPSDDTDKSRLEQIIRNSDQAQIKAEERAEAALAAYVQAKKYAEDLLQTIDTKEKEIDSLRKGAQRKTEVDAAELRRREQDATRISALESQIASKDAAIKAAQEKISVLTKENQHLEKSLKAAHASAHERMATALAAARRLEEREVQLRKEIEGMKGNAEVLRGQVQAAQEDKERLLQQDKVIIKKLQAEGRARVAELEARIAALQAHLNHSALPAAHSCEGFLGAGLEDDSDRTGDEAPVGQGSEWYTSMPPGDASCASRDTPAPAMLPLTPIPLSSPARSPAPAVPVGLCGASGDSSVASGGSASGCVSEGRRVEDLIRRSLRAIEDLIEVLMLRPEISSSMERDLERLESNLAPPSTLHALERRVDALCGLTQIAGDYLEVPLRRVS